jgi:hypothetical protein
MTRKSFKIFLYLTAIFLILLQSAYALNVVKLSPIYLPNTSIGRALSNADIYVGKPDLDPEIVANQKTLSVQQEDGTIVAVTQPISTGAGGVPLYEGSPVTLLVEGDYSLKVLDSSGDQIYYVPSTAYEKYLVTGNYYYPDYTEADQGVVGSGNSVTDILTEVGTTTKATLYFSHNSGEATTTYTFTTPTTITSNFNVIVEEGAIFSGTLYFAPGSINKVYPKWWGVNTTPGTTDMTSEIQSAIDSISAGDVVFNGQTYLISDSLIPESYVNFKGIGGATIKLAANSDTHMVDFSNAVTDVLIDGLIFDGNGSNQTRVVDTMNIIQGTAQIKRLTIRNNTFKNAACEVIRLNASLSHEDIIITGNRIYDNDGSGVDIYEASGVVISDNIIDNTSITATDDTTAIEVHTVNNFTISGNTIDLTDSTDVATSGISAGNTSYNGTVSNNAIKCNEGTYNNGISIHTSSSNITVGGNSIYEPGILAGIEVGGNSIDVFGNMIHGVVNSVSGIAVNNDSTNINIYGNGIYDYSGNGIECQISTGTYTNSYNISIIGNTLYNATGTNKDSILFNNIPYLGGVISGNTIHTNATGKGINLTTSSDESLSMSNMVISNNTIVGCNYGIGLYGTDGSGYIISGNSFSGSVTSDFYVEGSNHKIINNVPDTEVLTGTITITPYMGSASIDSSGGAVSATLGDGYFIGQIKTIVMTDASHSSTVSITHHETSDPEVATFDAVDETGVFMWSGTEWITIFATCTFV